MCCSKCESGHDVISLGDDCMREAQYGIDNISQFIVNGKSNKTYQPYIWEYWITWVSYGSCSGCDTMLGITEYGTGIPNENQVKDFMTLSLHIIQQLNSLHNIYENDI